MRRFIFTVGLILSGVSFAQGAPPPVPAQKPSAPTTFVATGEAVETPGGGFIITPPVGWQVITDIPGTTFLFQGPKIEPKPGETTFQPNIRVMSFDPEPMDDATKEKFSELLVANSSKLGGVANFNVRSAEKVSFQNGVEGFLYYTEFSLNATPMMQMHVLVSSAKDAYLMSYIDLASVFEVENSPALTLAYTSMQSVKLDSKPGNRFTQYYVIGGVIVAILLFLLIIQIVRGYKMKRLGDRIDSEDGGDTATTRDEDDDVSGFAALGGSTHRDQDDDEEAMPETHEAPRPAPKLKKAPAPTRVSAPAPAPVPVRVSAPAPAPVRMSTPAPVPAPAARAPAPAPAPLPKVAAAPQKPMVNAPPAPRGEVTAKLKTTAKSAPKPTLPDDDEQPISGQGDWNNGPASEVSEIKPKTVVTTKKAKPQKVQNPAKMKDVEADQDEDVSDVARLSEILPNTGDSKKKKGFFGWGKGKKADDDEDGEAAERIGDEDSWDDGRKKSSKKSSTDDEAPMSEVAGWNLKASSSAKSRATDDGDDD